MPDLRKLERQAGRVRELEQRAAAQRAVLYDGIRAALDAGATLSDVARAIGVSRQRMQRLARELRG